MSSSKLRLPYREAAILAEEVTQILSGVCERIQIAGSIRRHGADCGDIEVVCIPKRTGTDLFGELLPDSHDLFDALEGFCLIGYPFAHRLNKDGQKCFGKSMMLLTYKGFNLDVFCTSPEQWGVTLVVRTGPQAFSHKHAMHKSEGGLLWAGQQLKGWRIVERGKELDTPEEEDVFKAIGVEFVRPEDRA